MCTLVSGRSLLPPPSLCPLSIINTGPHQELPRSRYREGEKKNKRTATRIHSAAVSLRSIEMAETAITTVLSKFGELASREAAVLLEVGNEIMLLRDRLEWLQTFVRDADRKRRLKADEFTRVWVRQTRDVAFEAEDALDEFFLKVDLESLGYLGWKAWLKYLTGCTTQITVRHGLSGRIKSIKSRLDHISENHKEYKIEHTPSGTWTSSIIALAAWDDLEDHLVGFKDYLETLEKQLLGDDEVPQLAFFSILGESGIGKNALVDTLVNRIYTGRKRKHFEVFIWYNMPPNSSATDLLKEVHKRAERAVSELVTPEQHQNSTNTEQEDISDKLYNLLQGKRYLVILGGISSKTNLNCLKAGLPDESNGSRVVLTLEPESKEIARYADTLSHPSKLKRRNGKDHADTPGNTLKLSRLNEKECGELFFRRVFGKNKRPEEFKESYCTDVHRITRGLPLAIVVLAGLLRSKEIPIEWDAVLQQLMPVEEEAKQITNRIGGVLLSRDMPGEWDAVLQQLMPTGEAKLTNRMTIERILSLGFDDLPYDLKSCFLYFAAYPKNISHEADLILRMWAAEGFIKPQKGKTMEELGHDYLKELISRCLVEVKEKNDCGGIVLVQVHNRLLGFLQSEAREASFIEIHDDTDVLAPAAVRRLSIQNDDGKYVPFNNTFPKLRSIVCRVEEEVGSSANPQQNSKHRDLKFLYASKFLRVVSLNGLTLQELPNEFGDMIHLRYLGITSCGLKNLPSNIGKLLNLQTLDIRKTQVEKIAPKFWKIETLRHVLAEKLFLPKSVGDLNNLQTLHGVKAEENWDQGSCPLDKMINLRSLELHGLVANSHKIALTNALEKLELLEHLQLVGDSIPSCVFTAPSLRRLQSLVIEGKVELQENALDVCKLRPNLIKLILRKTTVPKVLNEFKPKLRVFETDQQPHDSI